MCDCVFCFFFSSRRRHTRCALVTGVQTCALPIYHFRQPQQALFDSPRGFLDLALTHRPGEARGSYVSAPGFSACPLGDIIFIPAHQGLRSQWGAGVQSSVCCQFNEPRADGRDDEDWALDELKASLNVRSPFVRDALVRLAREIE